MGELGNITRAVAQEFLTLVRLLIVPSFHIFIFLYSILYTSMYIYIYKLIQSPMHEFSFSFDSIDYRTSLIPFVSSYDWSYSFQHMLGVSGDKTSSPSMC